ncbi:MAG: RsmD family RNA methyltransferase [Dysgonamonadaceae bacterium]|jgi:16S rRNA (guanine(966)-N(2))-methyltransferase RsmD|nr:RsmD family RNA methyltransferase [Dysgonamonadaceae bacterium]
MRIISGTHRSRRFEIPKNFKSRPTTDFAKENIFNIIANLIDLESTSALDLFSGTGSIAFELISRGSREVTAVENEATHYNFIRKTQATLNAENLTVIRTDAFRYIRTTRHTFDLIFADPPYTSKRLAQIPALIFANNLLNPNGIFILEHPKEHNFRTVPQFIRHTVYGSVNFSIFRNHFPPLSTFITISSDFL